jgi:hypothetical protein
MPMACIPRLNGSAAAAAACIALSMLAGCGGESDAPSSATAAADGVSADVARDAGVLSAAAGPARLFIPDLAQRSVATLATLEPDAGEVLPAATLRTAAALGGNVQVDAARDELYAIVGQVVEVYAGASTLKADAAPARSFPLPSTLTAPHALYLDVARDELYVGGDTAHGNGEIVAYPYAHTLRGTPATPARALFVDHGVSFFTIDAVRERLYVVNADAGVHVFADAGSASGQLVAAATIPVLGTGLAVDPAHDRLYVADFFAGLILVDQASTPAPVVSATISIDDARFVSIDTGADRAYVSAQASLYVLDHASALTSAASVGTPATARVAGALLGAVAMR